MGLPTIPKIFGPVAQTLFFFIWPEYEGCHSVYTLKFTVIALDSATC